MEKGSVQVREKTRRGSEATRKHKRENRDKKAPKAKKKIFL
jgi:hypothetical protein